MSSAETMIVQSPQQGDAYWVLGDLYTFKAIGETTNQAYSLIEIVMQPQSRVPPHVHTHESESFYVQTGEMEFQCEGQRIIATPGTFLHLPPGKPHEFGNIGPTPAQMLCWLTPAGLEKFFMEIGISVTEQPTANAV
jgi:quercetin dioxygenase-like cupin family protein